MTCLTCSHSSLRDPDDAKRDRTVRAMAKHGMACCNLSPYRATFRPWQGKCPKYNPADAETQARRVEWASNSERKDRQ